MITSYQNELRDFKEAFESKHNGIYDLLVSTLTLIFIVLYILEENYLMNASVISLYFVCTFAMYKEKKYGCFLFYLTLFLFLLGTIFFGLFDPELKYLFSSVEAERHVLLSLALAIIGIYIGSVIKGRKIEIVGMGRGTYDRGGQKLSALSDRMRAFLYYASVLTLIADIVNALAKAVFVRANTYVAYYVDYQSPLPYFVIWFAAVAPLLFYFYLGSLPSKRKIIIPSLLYNSVGIVALFYGQRNVIVVRTIIILCYLLLRDRYVPNGEVWITKRQLRTVILLLPFGIAFMSFWRSYRVGEIYRSQSLLESVIEGLINQGNDVAILDYEFIYRTILPNKPYAIGGVIGFLRNNLIGRLLRLTPVPTQWGSAELAMNGYSFSAALMYQQNRNGYLLGYGIGSSYIAELYFTFGYIGIVEGSIIYGIILNRLGKIQVIGFIRTGFALAMFQYLLLAPKSTFDSFITGTFSVAHLFVAFVCWGLNKYVWSRK